MQTVGFAKKRRCDLRRGENGGIFRPRREAKAIEVDGVSWLCARVRPGLEFRVADDLVEAGFRAYAPHAVRVFLRRLHREARPVVRCDRDLPVFAGYVFVGCPAGLLLARSSHEDITGIVDGAPIPPRAIRAINELHIAGAWDDRARPDQGPFQVGSSVRFTAGAFAGWRAVVAGLPSPIQCVLEIDLFGSRRKVVAPTGQLEIA